MSVKLPKQLPARLTTIQQACLAATFAANPATCPTGSLIGIVKAQTPVLPVPLEGPAYLVSHGGAAFPDVVAILQGDGVRVNLTGNINIVKGITRARSPTSQMRRSRASSSSCPRARTRRSPPTCRPARRKPVRQQARDTHRPDRSERGSGQAEHQDRRHRLSQGQEKA